MLPSVLDTPVIPSPLDLGQSCIHKEAAQQFLCVLQWQKRFNELMRMITPFFTMKEYSEDTVFCEQVHYVYDYSKDGEEPFLRMVANIIEEIKKHVLGLDYFAEAKVDTSDTFSVDSSDTSSLCKSLSKLSLEEFIQFYIATVQENHKEIMELICQQIKAKNPSLFFEELANLNIINKLKVQEYAEYRGIGDTSYRVKGYKFLGLREELDKIISNLFPQTPEGVGAILPVPQFEIDGAMGICEQLSAYIELVHTLKKTPRGIMEKITKNRRIKDQIEEVSRDVNNKELLLRFIQKYRHQESYLQQKITELCETDWLLDVLHEMRKLRLLRRSVVRSHWKKLSPQEIAYLERNAPLRKTLHEKPDGSQLLRDLQDFKDQHYKVRAVNNVFAHLKQMEQGKREGDPEVLHWELKLAQQFRWVYDKFRRQQKGETSGSHNLCNQDEMKVLTYMGVIPN